MKWVSGIRNYESYEIQLIVRKLNALKSIQIYLQRIGLSIIWSHIIKIPYIISKWVYLRNVYFELISNKSILKIYENLTISLKQKSIENCCVQAVRTQR